VGRASGESIKEKQKKKKGGGGQASKRAKGGRKKNLQLTYTKNVVAGLKIGNEHEGNRQVETGDVRWHGGTITTFSNQSPLGGRGQKDQEKKKKGQRKKTKKKKKKNTKKP